MTYKMSTTPRIHIIYIFWSLRKFFDKKDRETIKFLGASFQNIPAFILLYYDT